MDAYDTDVVIYAAKASSPEGQIVRSHLRTCAADVAGAAGIGSTLLAIETLTKPLRDDDAHHLAEVAALLAQLDLLPCDQATAELAVDLGARYGLKTVDAVHLATAVAAGAERFITNNRRHLTKDITEIDITYPEDLAAATA